MRERPGQKHRSQTREESGRSAYTLVDVGGGFAGEKTLEASKRELMSSFIIRRHASAHAYTFIYIGGASLVENKWIFEA